jgi:hypothetical protein
MDGFLRELWTTKSSLGYVDVKEMAIDFCIDVWTRKDRGKVRVRERGRKTSRD